MDRKQELLGWIEKTHRLQRRVGAVFGGLAVVVFGLFFWNGTVAGLSLVILAMVAFCTFWITTAHVMAHRHKLRELDQLAEAKGKPLRTGHRRWRER